MSHDSPSNATKACARCGVDCTDLPRVKDEKGRYFCRPCYDRAITQMASKIVETAPSAGGVKAGADDLDAPADILGVVESETVFEHGRGGGTGASAGGAYELAEPERKAAVPTKECPSCQREMRKRDSICPHCGFNTILGIEAEEARPTVTAKFKGGKLHCGSCGYCIENLGSQKCPECGSPNRVPSRREWDQEDAAEVARQQIVRPAIYLAVGLAGFGGLALLHQSAALFVGYLIIYAVSFPAVVFAFLMCSLMWLGFNDKISIVIWKLAGIMAITSLVLFAFMGLGLIYPLFLAGAAFALLIGKELDVEWSDAWLVGLAVLLAQVAMYFVCRSIFF